MKKTFKTRTILTLALSCAMIASLSACATNSATSTPPADVGTSAGDVESGPKLDPYGAYEETLSFTCSRYVQTNPNLPEGDTYEDNAYTRYLEKRINAKMISAFEAPGGDAYDRQIALTIASGDLPDIMTITDHNILTELVNGDMIEDLTTVFADYSTPTLASNYGSYGDRALGKATFDGKLMALPSAMGDGAPSIVWVREDWLNKLELEVDADGDQLISIEELETIIRAFQEKDPGGTGNPVGISLDRTLLSTHFGGAHNTLSVGSVFNAYPRLWIAGKDGNITYGSIEPETKQMLEKLNSWYNEGLLDSQVGTRTWEDMNALMINNQTGVCFGAWHITDWMLTGVREINPDATFKSYVLKDSAGNVNAFHTKASNNFVVVRKGFAHPELVVKIANIFYDELTGKIDDPGILEYQSLGVDNSTKPLWIEVGASDSVVKEYDTIRAVVLDGAEMDTIISTGNQSIAQLCKDYIADPAGADITAWARYHSRMRGLETTKMIYDGNFFQWVDPVFWGSTPTMEKRKTNLDTIEDEAFIKIITGAESLDSFDAFVATWRAEGGDAILAEVAAEVQTAAI